MQFRCLAYRSAFYRVFRKDRHISSEGGGHRFEFCWVRHFGKISFNLTQQLLDRGDARRELIHLLAEC